MLGYWQDPAATADVLSADGWLRTGDLAHRDEDGYFYLHGRANLLVKVQGHRVHPAEIETLVEAGFPHTRAVAVPMARGDETRFVLFLAARDDRPIDVAKIRATCQRELPPYKVPVRFDVLDRFPLTSAQKVDRAALVSSFHRSGGPLRNRAQPTPEAAAAAVLFAGNRSEGNSPEKSPRYNSHELHSGFHRFRGCDIQTGDALFRTQSAIPPTGTFCPLSSHYSSELA